MAMVQRQPLQPNTLDSYRMGYLLLKLSFHSIMVERSPDVRSLTSSHSSFTAWVVGRRGRGGGEGWMSAQWGRWWLGMAHHCCCSSAPPPPPIPSPQKNPLTYIG